MKPLLFVFCFVYACVGLSAQKRNTVWQPSPGHAQMPIWPGAAPDPQPVAGPEYAETSGKDFLPGGRPAVGVSNVTRPTITVYSPEGKNTGAAVVVFPGGGFQGLAMGLEGTEVCDWLTSRGVTCILLKYRVPSAPYVWRCNCRPHNLSLSTPSLQDAQRSVRLVRFHAAEWRIDPRRIGVLGFSAGGYLVAEVSTHFGDRLLNKPCIRDVLPHRLTQPLDVREVARREDHLSVEEIADDPSKQTALRRLGGRPYRRRRRACRGERHRRKTGP